MDKNQNEVNPYPGLEHLSLKDLEELLRQDFRTSDDMDTDYTMAIMEVIKRRKTEDPNYMPADVQAARKSFEENYMNKESPYLHLFPSNETLEVAPEIPESPTRGSRKRLRRLITVAAVLVLLIGILTAQALGYNVFRIIAQWTTDTFTFGGTVVEYPSDPPLPFEVSPDRQYESIQEVLDDIGIILQVVPLWYPYGFVQTELIVTHFSESIIINSILESEDKLILISITVGVDSERFRIHEIDHSGVLVHEAGGITHYIMSNYDRMVAVWLNGNLEGSIQGDITEAELLRMIDSIYGG